MRKVILASMFLAVALVAFGQHGTSQIGGKTARKSKAKPKPTPTPYQDKPFDTPCGVHYKNLADLFVDTKDEWQLVAVNTTGDELTYRNPGKERCEAGILKTWIKAVEWKTWNYSISRYELKCRSNQFRIVGINEYDKDGGVLTSNTYPDENWMDAIPDSVGEEILNTVCHKK